MNNINQKEKNPLKFFVGIFIVILILIPMGMYILAGKILIGKSAVWKTYPSSKLHAFSFAYPDTDKISEDNYGYLLLNSPGYYYIDMISTQSAKPLKSLLEERIAKDEMNGRTIIQPLTATKIGNYSGFKYVLFGKIESTLIYLQKDSSTYGEIIYSIQDANKNNYQSEISKIIASFKFTN